MLATIALIAGWLLHLGFWTWALRRVGRNAARAEEWLREAALRALMLALILTALLVPRGNLVPLDATGRGLLMLAFLLGQALAITARLRLAEAWGLGVTPRTPGRMVRSGPYGVVRHPIYLGTGMAILAQCALLQNLPAGLLALGAAVLIPAKMLAERASIRSGA